MTSQSDIQFDVFLCHNSNDKMEIKRIGEQLKQQGLKPWLDEWEFRPGLPWQRELLEFRLNTTK
ncbi:MAG: toll/interleukin-1 receptor domain-containing protein [Cyanobacteria bacterium P01_H01_bin.150]